MIKDWKATVSLNRVNVGDTIKENDLCKTITGEYIPAVACVGRKVRPENWGYVFRSEVNL